MKTQKEMFEEWIMICTNLKYLNGYIQNDLYFVLADGYTNESEIKHSIVEFQKEYAMNMKKLNNLFVEIQKYQKSFLTQKTYCKSCEDTGCTDCCECPTCRGSGYCPTCYGQSWIKK